MEINTFPFLDEGTGTITLTVMSDAIPSQIQFRASARKLVMDWGDGSAPEIYDSFLSFDDYFDITHTYTSHTAYTGQIRVEGLTDLNCAFNKLTSLDVCGCTWLKNLE